jgi:hypothetical protein
MRFLPFHTDNEKAIKKKQAGFTEHTVSLAFTVEKRRARVIARIGMKFMLLVCLAVGIMFWKAMGEKERDIVLWRIGGF